MVSKKLQAPRPFLPPLNGGWLDAELAEMGRLEGVFRPPLYAIERGMSEEGDPWFVVTETTSGRVVVHLCRIAAKYTVACPEEMLLKTTADIKVAVELAMSAT